MGEAASRAFKQLLHIALGYSLSLRHPCWGEVGIVKLAFDRLAKAVKDRRLGCGSAGVGCRRRELPYQCRQHVGKALGDRQPFGVGKRLEISRSRFQRARKHLGESTWCQYPNLVEYRLS